MQTTDNSLKLLMNLAKVNAVLSRQFDRLSAHGISFSDFMILYLLAQAPDEKIRRIDLAEKIGLTASGVTRMLVPLEKIGLIKREINERDARVSYAMLTPTGKQIFVDAMVTANQLAKDIVPQTKMENITALAEMLTDLGGNIS